MTGKKRKNTDREKRNTPAGNAHKKANVSDSKTPCDIKMKRRAFFILIVFSSAMLFMLYRIGFIDFIKGAEYRKSAYSYQTSQRLINPKRGAIYDRNGQGLAISAPACDISVNPQGLRKELENDDSKLGEIAAFIAPLLEMDESDLLALFKKDSPFEYLKRMAGTDVGDKIKAYVADKELLSINIDNVSKRFYPKGTLASHVLGFTGIDGQGLSGIELSLDSTLRGTPGKLINDTDVLGNQIKYSPDRQADPVDGCDVTLTIDATIQYMAEKAIKQAVLDDSVKMGAAAIVMDPNNGEVLAMASYPDFDPNKPDSKPDSVEETDWKGFKSEQDTQTLYETVFRNKTVMDTYEPGSTFKAITAAAALEEGVVSPSTQVVDKPYSLAGWDIDCWLTGGHGPEDFIHAVYNSCNPVFAKVAVSLGVDKFYEYARMFGFMKQTGIEVSGEPSDQSYMSLWHENPQDIDIAVAGFGQRFQISPIQMAAAYSAIANGGSLLKPTLIRQVNDGSGNIIQKNEPQVVRKVISEKTSEELRSILEGVVSQGTGKNAYISGYRIAGKTGTSETLQTETEGRYVVSFAAMAPADKPRIVVIVVLDDPRVDPKRISGSVLAAPVAGKLCENILEYLQVDRQYSEADQAQISKEVIVPEITNLTVKEAADKLKAYGLTYLTEGSGDGDDAVIYGQNPKADSSIPQNGLVVLYTSQNPEAKTVPMPELANKTIDEAAAAMKKASLNIRIKGEGGVSSQEFPAGTPVEEGTVVEVDFVMMIKD